MILQLAKMWMRPSNLTSNKLLQPPEIRILDTVIHEFQDMMSVAGQNEKYISLEVMSALRLTIVNCGDTLCAVTDSGPNRG